MTGHPQSHLHHLRRGGGDAAHTLHEVEGDALCNQNGQRTATDHTKPRA